METIEKLIELFEAIPSERWTKNTLSTWASANPYAKLPEQNCAFGHLNKHLTGNWSYDRLQSWGLVTNLWINPLDLIAANNAPGDAKENVINFLKQNIRELCSQN